MPGIFDRHFERALSLLNLELIEVDSPLTVLSLGCGSSRETPSLLKQLCEKRTSTHFVGVDIRDHELSKAEDLLNSYRQENSLSLTHEFICTSAARLDALKQLPRKFDVVLFRHQNYWHDAALWSRMFEGALERLGPKGTILITSYFDQEHFLALNAISRLGGIVTQNIRNPDSQGLVTPGKSIDRWVAKIRLNNK